VASSNGHYKAATPLVFLKAERGPARVKGGTSKGKENIPLSIIRGCNQKFPDRVDNEINNNKHSLRSNTKGYGGKTHYTDSQKK
jgi:hypothetical protein